MLTRDFPRFDDRRHVRGRDGALLEARAALGLDPAGDAPGGTGFQDLDRLTAFADYIVPAALRVLGITRYSDELEERSARAG